MDGEVSEPIFLYNNRIFNWRSTGRFHFTSGSTKIEEFKGLLTLEERIGRYDVKASAAQYVATVQESYVETPSKPPPEERLILFDGGIQIYDNGDLPGTELEGSHLIISGRILSAVPPDPLSTSQHGLRNLVAGWDSQLKAISRVERAILGYRQQDLKRSGGNRYGYRVPGSRR